MHVQLTEIGLPVPVVGQFFRRPRALFRLFPAFRPLPARPSPPLSCPFPTGLRGRIPFP
ncbi:predicted protein [Streptomyces viridosporus ATCC 14672]|nr:predicted protein [Streptomyces viridosporus ATCC 14672]